MNHREELQIFNFLIKDKNEDKKHKKEHQQKNPVSAQPYEVLRLKAGESEFSVQEQSVGASPQGSW